MNLFKSFQKIQKGARIFDWVMAAASLIYGAWAHNYWWIGAGILLFVIAWFDPGARIRDYFGAIKTKQTPVASPAPRAAKPARPRKKRPARIRRR